MTEIRIEHTVWRVTCVRSGLGAGYAPDVTTKVYFDAGDGQRRIVHTHLLPPQVEGSLGVMIELFRRSNPVK